MESQVLLNAGAPGEATLMEEVRAGVGPEKGWYLDQQIGGEPGGEGMA